MIISILCSFGLIIAYSAYKLWKEYYKPYKE